MKPFYLILATLVPLFWGAKPLQAQTTLTAGDIVIIGYNYDASPQEMAIVTLVPITAGTRIFIADYAYEAGAFVPNTLANNNEGSIEWVTTGNIAAGTVFRVQMASTNAGTTVTGLPGTLTIRGWAQVFGAGTVNATNTPAAAGGDAWFIYQGTAYNTPTQFVFGWANWATTAYGVANGWMQSPQTVGTNTQVSHLPAPLVNGTTARSLSWFTANGGMHGDNNVYTGTRTGTKAQLLAVIGDLANWSTNETTTYDISPGGTYFPGATPQFTVVASTMPVTWGSVQALASPSQQSITLSWTTYAEPGNRYFTVEHSIDGRSWKTLGQVSAQGSHTSGATYEYAHLSPGLGTQYYRLQQTDQDGRFSYSNTATAVITRKLQLRIYPNPGRGHLVIERPDSEAAQLTVFDLLGRFVYQQNIKGNRITLSLHIPPGYYQLRIVSAKTNITVPYQVQ